MDNTYKVISSSVVKNLEDEINIRLSEGWTLVGGVSVTTRTAVNGELRISYYQAITKTK
jgi:hypothetical protein